MHFDPAIAAELHRILSHRLPGDQVAGGLERRSFLKLGAAAAPTSIERVRAPSSRYCVYECAIEPEPPVICMPNSGST